MENEKGENTLLQHQGMMIYLRKESQQAFIPICGKRKLRTGEQIGGTSQRSTVHTPAHKWMERSGDAKVRAQEDDSKSSVKRVRRVGGGEGDVRAARPGNGLGESRQVLVHEFAPLELGVVEVADDLLGASDRGQKFGLLDLGEFAVAGGNELLPAVVLGLPLGQALGAVSRQNPNEREAKEEE